MAKPTVLKPDELVARSYADRLILDKLTDLYEVVKPSEIADLLTNAGLGLGTVRSLLASNTERFAYAERRWIPVARLEGLGRPLVDAVYVTVERYGAPMSISLVARELSRTHDRTEDWVENSVRRFAQTDPRIVLTKSDDIAIDQFVFVAKDEAPERAFAINRISTEEVEEAQAKLGNFDWLQEDAIMKALELASPVSLKALSAAAWLTQNQPTPTGSILYNWKEFAAELLSIPGFLLAADGNLYPESEAKKWVTLVSKFAEKLNATVEVEDATPLELKSEDVEKSVQTIVDAAGTVTATHILENQFEITSTVKTFPDDMANLMSALKKDARVLWVGGDRFKKPGEVPDYIRDIPEPFDFVRTEFLQEDGELVDIELADDGLSSSLRKLIVHPLATDVRDEEAMPAPKTMPDALRLVLKPIHRELGTFPMAQFPTGWLSTEPELQELILINPAGEELQVWANHKSRLLFNLIDWWLDQPIESGAVFSLTKTYRPNVFEFAWLDQTDPIVYISNQRMEELRELASRAEAMPTFDVVREVMTHWPKGADFLTLLWEVNVVRRTSRRLLASLLSSYLCFYQRSGSPVWHYDHKKVEQGFDKSKKKFILR